MTQAQMNGRLLNNVPFGTLKTSSPRNQSRKRKLLPKADAVLYRRSIADRGASPSCSSPSRCRTWLPASRGSPTVALWPAGCLPLIDTAQVVAKLQLTMTKRYSSGHRPNDGEGDRAGTALMSMALNVLAFLSGATDRTGTVLAWVAGVMLPLLILALSYTGSPSTGEA